MSPEQARGRPVDKRADIWAFGGVLYEMLTGRPVFSGESTTDILAGVVQQEPVQLSFGETGFKFDPGALNIAKPRKSLSEEFDILIILIRPSV